MVESILAGAYIFRCSILANAATGFASQNGFKAMLGFGAVSPIITYQALTEEMHLPKKHAPDPKCASEMCLKYNRDQQKCDSGATI
jgi:hypothetical protein